MCSFLGRGGRDSGLLGFNWRQFGIRFATAGGLRDDA